MASPSFSLERHRHSQERTQVSDRPIQFLKVHVQRIALRAARLLVQTDPMHVHTLEDGFVEQTTGGFRILWIDAEFDASHKVGDKPVEAHQVIVS
jgi:hypothetical protein